MGLRLPFTPSQRDVRVAFTASALLASLPVLHVVGCGDDAAMHQDVPGLDGGLVPTRTAGTTSAGAAGAGAASSAGNGGLFPTVKLDGGPAAEPQVPVPSLLGDVDFSVPSQAFVAPLAVDLSTGIDGAEIRYTTDGTLPMASSPLHDGSPLSLTETTQLRARPFVDGVPAGAISTALYVARDFEQTSNLPIVIVDGYAGGKPMDKDVYLDAALLIFEPVNGVASLASLPTVAARAGYHVRGQSSARFPKTPYRLELWDNADEDSDYPLLGMPAQSDWALISPYYDRTLIRNPFVYELGRDMGLAAPRSVHVEVFLSYEGGVLHRDDYQGIYWFTEFGIKLTNLKSPGKESSQFFF